MRSIAQILLITSLINSALAAPWRSAATAHEKRLSPRGMKFNNFIPGLVGGWIGMFSYNGIQKPIGNRGQYPRSLVTRAPHFSPEYSPRSKLALRGLDKPSGEDLRAVARGTIGYLD
ncbi:hypothetical protein F5148DRAFT_1286592 [Russula earlei]|uniref:Uncharacterized protein n=1 Tax=Russula earlei TaxID=71964 RepID=A0ACC0U3N8_9AGAM|nr:hypothetical protein F5148DRAFT_1286592 [Russula earlei]